MTAGYDNCGYCRRRGWHSELISRRWLRAQSCTLLPRLLSQLALRGGPTLLCSAECHRRSAPMPHPWGEIHDKATTFSRQSHLSSFRARKRLVIVRSPLFRSLNKVFSQAHAILPLLTPAFVAEEHLNSLPSFGYISSNSLAGSIICFIRPNISRHGGSSRERPHLTIRLTN